MTVVDGRVTAGPNLEARLRDVRRAAALAAAEGDPIATGHTATDRAETVLYRLATSGGVNALPALPPAAPPFYRPLLDVTRDEVRDELRRRGLDWREDASNDDPAFARNRIRNEALPVLLALNPRADANIARTAEVAAAERELLAALAAPFVADGAADLAFRDEHVALQREVVRQAAAAAGVTVQHADVEALIGPDGARRRTLPGGAEAVTVGGWLRFHAPKLESPPMSGIDPAGQVVETLIDSDTLQARIAELGAQITQRLRRRPAAARVRAEGRVHVRRRPGAGDRPARRGRLHGDLAPTARARRRRGSCGS